MAFFTWERPAKGDEVHFSGKRYLSKTYVKTLIKNSITSIKRLEQVVSNYLGSNWTTESCKSQSALFLF